MKKCVLALAAWMLLVFACAASAEQSGGFAPLCFSFWADGDAGYEWVCEYENNGVLDLPMQEIVGQGEGCNYEFNFGVLAAGEAEIFFNYGVNWEVRMPERTVICNVVVDAQGNCAVKRAEIYPDDQMLVFSLPSNPTTGWSWNYQGESEDGGMVSLVSEEYTPIDAALEGAGGNTVYQMKVERPGETVLLFNYSNLWSPDAAAQETYAVVVTANDEMEISISVED